MELFTVSIAAFMVTMVTDLFRRFNLSPWQTRGLVILFSLVMGICWYVFQTYFPMTVQIEVQNFVAGTLAGAVLFYEFIIKHIE